MAGIDDATKATMSKLPLCTIKAGPRDGEDWIKRVKEEYKALIQYQQVNKEAGNEWFTIEAANKTGTRWQGKVWTFHDSIKYEFDLEFDIPVSYPSVAPELALPELDGKTEKMYRGGKARAAATAAAATAAAARRLHASARLTATHPRRSASTRTSGRCGRATSRASASRTRWRWAWARGSRWRSRRSSRWGGSSRRTKNDEITGQIR